MNKIVLIGNLTHDPDTRSTPNGVTVCSFTIAVNRRFASQGGEKQTDFFRINAWRQLGDVCSRYLAKGRKVAVIGELQARTYEAKDGTTRMSLDVSADEVEFLTPKGNSYHHKGLVPAYDCGESATITCAIDAIQKHFGTKATVAAKKAIPDGDIVPTTPKSAYDIGGAILNDFKEKGDSQ